MTFEHKGKELGHDKQYTFSGQTGGLGSKNQVLCTSFTPYLKEDAGELGVRHPDRGEVRESHEGVALAKGEGVSHQEE